MFRISSQSIKYGVSFVLVAALLVRADISSMFANLGQVAIGALAITFCLAVSQVFITTARWYMLLRAMNIAVPLRDAMEVNVLGILANTLLVNVVGGVATRMTLLAGMGVPSTKTLASIVVERILILFVLVVMSVLGLFWVRWPMEFRALLPLELLSAGAGVVVLVGFVAFQSGLLRNWTVHAVAYLRRILLELQDIVSHRLTLGSAFALTVLNQAVLVTMGIVVAKAVGIQVPTFDLLMLLPTVSLLSSLPISAGGFGVREVSLVVALSAFGVPTEQALLMSIILGILSLLGALVTGFLALGVRTVSGTAP
jgi:uncharacterized membrane protein YbhN (UPF0104 family)